MPTPPQNPSTRLPTNQLPARTIPYRLALPVPQALGVSRRSLFACGSTFPSSHTLPDIATEPRRAVLVSVMSWICATGVLLALPRQGTYEPGHRQCLGIDVARRSTVSKGKGHVVPEGSA